MRTNIVRMEAEQAAMVAEVEAQIERALQSMIMSESDPDDHDIEVIVSPHTSRPSSRRSSVTSGSGSRALRSFGTESTLAEDIEAEAEPSVPEKQKQTQAEQNPEEKADAEPKKLKRFSATQHDAPGDGMNTVDENISERSDRISRKVLEIQQKVRRDVRPATRVSLHFLARERVGG
jgi:EEF1A N-terminal glycine/lysine methyltransferase